LIWLPSSGSGDCSCARELFHAAGDNIEEEQAVDDAIYATGPFSLAAGSVVK
jgi:hypothetical protein